LLRELREAGVEVSYFEAGTLSTKPGSVIKKPLRSVQDCPDMARKRWFWKRHQGKIDGIWLIFVDETWVQVRREQKGNDRESGRLLISS
jgi:hypothetical protein